MPEPEDDLLYSGKGSRPIPDPTLLTTQQLQLAISGLRELVFTRLDAVEKSIDLFQQSINRMPGEVTKEITHLRALIDERFNSNAVRFAERDARSEATKRDAKDAVDAALASAQQLVTMQQTSAADAIAKSEAATSKSVDQLQILIQTAISTLDGKIGDVKERITTIESMRIGQAAQQTSQQVNVGQWVGIIGLVLGTIVGISGLVIAFSSAPTPTVAPIVIERQGAAGPVRAPTTTTTTTP